MYDMGNKSLDVLSEGGRPMRVRGAVADVTNILMSVSEMVDQGNLVCFGPKPEHCFMKNIATGIKEMIPRKGKLFKMKFSVLEPKPHSMSEDVNRVQGSSGASSTKHTAIAVKNRFSPLAEQGFQRQV